MLGRIIAKHHVGEAPGESASSQFAYDALDRLIQATNAVSDVQIAYDPLGRLLAETQLLHGPFGTRTFELSHQYDALGNRTRTVLPDGRELRNLFYGSGHLHQIHVDGQIVSNFERDALYREVRRSQGQLLSEFGYDRADRLNVQQVLHALADGFAATPPSGVASPTFSGRADARGPSAIQRPLTPVIERRYTYDACGQLVQWLDRHRGLTRHGYDAAGRIIRSQIGLRDDGSIVGVRADWSANVTGRRIAVNEKFDWDAASNPLPAEGFAGAHVPGNRLLVWQDTRYHYDDHGNLVERLQGKRGSLAQIRTRLYWDAAHQLIRADVVRVFEASASTQTYRFAYDALGRRIAKTDAFGSTHFAWDSDCLTLEQRGGNEILYLYHPDSFVPLAQFHNGALHHLHTDHLGTPLEASNDAGEITWQVTYRTWGNLVTEEVTEIQQMLRFQGQYFDAETGLHYNRFRYYEPEVGRFISQDPIGLMGGFNLYQHSPTPTGWIDPLGLAGAGGAYMYEFKKGGKYIGKGLKDRLPGSKKRIRRGKQDCLLGEARVDTGGDNELGKMVEYRAMQLSGFTPTGIPAAFANTYLSGKTAWDDPANVSKRATATKKAKELIKKFEEDKAARAKKPCGCK